NPELVPLHARLRQRGGTAGRVGPVDGVAEPVRAQVPPIGGGDAGGGAWRAAVRAPGLVGGRRRVVRVDRDGALVGEAERRLEGDAAPAPLPEVDSCTRAAEQRRAIGAG